MSIPWNSARRCFAFLLHYVAVCCNVLQISCSMLQCVAVCCSVMQCLAMSCSVLQCVVVCCSVLSCVAVCCSAHFYTIELSMEVCHRLVAYLGPGVVLCCSVLQRVAACFSVLQRVFNWLVWIISQNNVILGDTLQHTAIELKHTATNCNTLQHISAHCNTLQHIAAHRNTPQ